MKTAIKILILTLIIPYLMTGCGMVEHQKTETPVSVVNVTIQSVTESIL